MHDNPANHAMTEVALGLAMAFFSIMVLAMVSMSVPSAAISQAHGAKPQAKSLTLSSPSAANSKPGLKADQLLLIYYQKQFFNRQMHVLDVAQIAGDQPVVLALPPAISLQEAILARSEIFSSNLTITSLDPHWMQFLETKK